VIDGNAGEPERTPGHSATLRGSTFRVNAATRELWPIGGFLCRPPLLPHAGTVVPGSLQCPWSGSAALTTRSRICPSRARLARAYRSLAYAGLKVRGPECRGFGTCNRGEECGGPLTGDFPSDRERQELADSDELQILADSRGSPWPRIAAVGKRGSCREGQLTGAVANSHYRPQPAVAPCAPLRSLA
jgi:hypothetical protein